jgi:hypothetical protein
MGETPHPVPLRSPLEVAAPLCRYGGAARPPDKTKDFAAKERRERKEGELELQSKASGGGCATALGPREALWTAMIPVGSRKEMR